MHKRFLKSTLILMVTALVLFGSLIYAFDPYFKYHAPFFGLKPHIYSNIYQNPGMADNFEYDSVIIGSSMTENFRVSWFDEAFDINTVKLSYPAGRLHNYAFVLEKSFENRKIEKVFWGLDIDPLIDTYLNDHFDMPDYMYDNNIFSDVNYLLNKSVFFEEVYSLIKKNKYNEVKDIDEAFTWDHLNEFSRERAINSYKFPKTIEGKGDYDYYMENARLNLGNIIPFIAEYPETDFYVFLPPYSILFWDTRRAWKDTEDVMKVLDYAMGELLKYDNVKLFYFQNNEDIILNLDNYKDYTHYSGEINRFMLEAMKHGQYQVTLETYKEELKKMYEIASKYDYNTLIPK